TPFVVTSGGSSCVGCGMLDETMPRWAAGGHPRDTLNGFPIDADELSSLVDNGHALPVDVVANMHRPGVQITHLGFGIITYIIPGSINVDGPPGSDPSDSFATFDRYEIARLPSTVGNPSSNPCEGYGLLQRFNKLRDDSSTVAIRPYIHKSVEDDFQAALNEINKVVPEGIGFTEMFRTFGYQKQLYDAWVDRGKTGNQVAMPGRSRHEGGFAFDVKGMGEKGKPTALAKLIIPIFEKYGFRWGGRFKKPDPPHFEADFRRGGYKSSQEAATAARNYYDNCIVQGREGLGKAQ
ncbi:MAG: M15 family metallopeptidase, partial [Acidobacteria bacterium]|nr:M15 family metallopeptidase [Acidobacteriota bacterium]